MIITKRRPIGKQVNLQDITTDWFKTYSHLSKEIEHHVLLESGRGGRYSIIGLSPWAVIKGKNQRLIVRTSESTDYFEGPLLSSLRTWLSSYKVDSNKDLPEFQGGLIGQLSYDLIREIERLPNEADDDLNTDDVYLLAFDEVYVIDHREEKIWFIALVPPDQASDGEDVLKNMMDRWREGEQSRLNDTNKKNRTADVSIKKPSHFSRSFQEDVFKEAVEKTKQYIRDGDVFQVNLSVRESREAMTEPIHIYDCLRKINPSPYMGYFHTPELQYVSASPELLVKVQGEEVSTRPIAGTRSRGKNEQEDQALADTLLNNEKERAEHIMLVDLERNDLGRVCQYGSVEVDELMVIEKYSHVMHIVSNVKGIKAADYDALDVIAATFPGGTITGAPKIRTMEIIEELEPVRRGAYTGSLGWIGFQGDMELNITIRTMIVKDGMCHVQAGAGIVIDSDPKAEYKESLKKAKALWKAKEMSEEELRRNEE
ncbi:aminodeoxychorismate synthase component I [Salipaludibacillus keqinensis]|uniref:Aminodeoxychorismate synthase component I n=1 Tax=Salipaludibacillus keqinensis TaxID=2045207 RepID=A0A323T8A7_9BACI|nr:anthranilate synthase component I family protein [Salipaludibacillus keqinensis]PYZ91570.1 aminodeoxychorismate synthase component I [Salipaludibacillus keqinensis]